MVASLILTFGMIFFFLFPQIGEGDWHIAACVEE